MQKDRFVEDLAIKETSSGHGRASLELDPLSKTQTNRINHIIDKMLVETNNKASQHHNESRHEQKAANIAKGAKGSSAINAGTSKSESTEDKYKSAMKGLMSWAYQSYEIKDPMQIKPEHIKEFCVRLIDNGFSRNSFEGYTKAFSFWGGENGVLKQYSPANAPNWSAALQEMRELSACCIDKEHRRAYDDPRAIINELSGTAKTIAELQFECGLRVSDACYIKAENWNAAKGEGIANSKGGQKIEFRPPSEIARIITSAINENGSFGMSIKAYSDELRGAVARTGQTWEASHGMRAAAAEKYILDCKAAGMTYKQALSKTGEFLGHHRDISEVTKTYVQGVGAW